jgi:hypothetical protein
VRFTGSGWCQRAPEGSNDITIRRPWDHDRPARLQPPGPGNTTAVDNSGAFDDVTVRAVDNVGRLRPMELSGLLDGRILRTG